MNSTPNKQKIIVPFLKWAGGKRWLVKNYSHIFPQKFNRYIEPFLGSGALFFSLQPKKAILSDLNIDLIEAYNVIKGNPAEIKKLLCNHHEKHHKEYYYSVRSSIPTNSVERAARLIYLNRTCWNALYRVNLKGEFNVPIGTKSSVVLPSDNFDNVASILRHADIYSADFEETINKSKKNDFLFVDPPYTVKHNTNAFVKYNETIFSWDDQIRLMEALISADKRGAKILLTNANHTAIEKLYEGKFRAMAVNRKSVIAASSKNRGTTSELLISNFKFQKNNNE